MNGEKSLRVCGEESPGDEYTFSLVSDLCPQGPCSGLDSEGRTPYKEDLHPLQPRSQLCQTKWGRGPVQGLRLGQGGNTPSPNHHRPTEHRACRARSGCPGIVIRLQSAERLPRAAISLPGLHCPRVDGSATAASLGGQLAHLRLCTLQLSQSQGVL